MAHKTFLGLLSGQKGYAFNLVSLIGVTEKKEAITIVKQQITDTLARIQDHKTIETPYYIGITSTEALQRKDLHPMDETTMKKDVISKRWQDHKGKGNDGIVIVTVITQVFAKAMGFKDNPKESDEKKRKNPKSAALKCALHLEEELQKQLELRKESDPHHPGSTSKYTEAYPLYVAFKYLRPRNGSESSRQVRNSCHTHTLLTHITCI